MIGPKMPAQDDEVLRFSFYKHVVEDADLSNLTIPRTFFGRSGFTRVDFRNTDLTESRMCWNDFIECDFRGAGLSHCDMRSSVFTRCQFGKATLQGADLRGAWFEECTFRGAEVWGAIADYVNADETDFDSRLTEKQRKAMEWHEDPATSRTGGEIAGAIRAAHGARLWERSKRPATRH